MSDEGVILSSSRSGQLVWVDYARPPTSEGHISFVRTPILVFLGSMERKFIQEYIHMPERDIRCLTKVLDRALPGQVSSLVQVSSFGLTTCDLQLRKVISPSFELRFWCSWTLWKENLVKNTFICLRKIVEVRKRC